MSTLTCGFEGGTLNGAVDTSGGDASTPITVTAAWVYSNTHKNRGTLAAKLPSTATGTQRLAWVLASPPSTILMRSYTYMTSQPSADTFVLHCPPLADQSAGIGTRAIVNSLGAARLTDNAGGVQATNTGTAVLTGQFIRWELWLDAGTSTTTGSMRAAYYLGNSTTPVWDSGLLTGKNTAGAVGSFQNPRFGASNSSAGDQWYDDIAVKTGTDAVWGAWPVTNALPIVDAGPNQVAAASSLVNLSGTYSDTDGTVTGVAWTVTYSSDPTITTASLTGAGTATPSFTTGSAVGSLYILTLTVTDNDGGISTDTVEVRVLTTGNATILPGNGTGDAWSIIGGSATQGAALADGSTTTRVESGDMSTTASVHQWRVAPMASRSALLVALSATVLTTAIPGGHSDTSVARLYSGTTQVAQWSLAATTTDQTVNYNLTSGEIAAITDWGELYVQVRAVTS